MEARNIKYTTGVFILLFTSMQLRCLCQQKSILKDSTEFSQKLCHEWNIFYKIDTLIRIYPPVESFSSIQFFKNGRVLVKKSTSQNGVWVYDISSQILIIRIGKQEYQLKVIKLSETELIFNKEAGNGFLMNGYLWRE